MSSSMRYSGHSSYVIGFTAERELPIVGKIATGSLRNKLLILLPAALALSYFVPWAITPLLMFGGAYLCYEGVEKVSKRLCHTVLIRMKLSSAP